MSDKALKSRLSKTRIIKQKPKSLPIRTAQALINTLARDSFNVLIPVGEHAEQRKYQREFTRSDIEEILRDGIIRAEPIWVNDSWRYKVEVIGFRGRIGAAVVTLIVKDKTELRVVTVMWLDRR